MTAPLVTALGLAPLRWRDVAVTATAPVLGAINTYNTATAGTDLSMTLPTLVGETVGATMLLEKDPLDLSARAVSFTTTASQFFTDGTTSVTLTDPGQQVTLQVVDVSGDPRWKLVSSNGRARAATLRRAVTSVAGPSASQTINVDTTDVAKFTAVANSLYLTFSGTPVDEQPLKVVITDNGTSRALSFDPAKFGVLGAIGGLPASTPTGRRMSMQFVYDAGYSRMILTAVDTVGYVY